MKTEKSCVSNFQEVQEVNLYKLMSEFDTDFGPRFRTLLQDLLLLLISLVTT